MKNSPMYKGDMLNDGLYRFLTRKCKERNFPIEKLPERFGFSRSSLYRYMKGIIRMTEEVQAKFVDVFRFDEAEQREFTRFVDLSEFDGALIAARHALDGFVFGIQGGGPAKDSAPIKFAYHENDTYLRTSGEVFGLIADMAAAPGATCRARIVGCLADGIFRSASDLLVRLFAACANVTCEHLLAFSEKDHLHNTRTLINILPLLKYGGYSVYYNEQPGAGGDAYGGVYGNVVLLEITRSMERCGEHGGEQSNYFCITYLDGELSACLSTRDKNVFAFAVRNYEAARKKYDAALLDTSGIDIIGGRIAELQENSSTLLIKPNCCYDRIPMSVYHSLLDRSTAEERDVLRAGLGAGLMGDGNGDADADMDFRAGIGVVFANLERRIAASYRHPNIDVCSADGLTQFARTGRLTDHLDCLPAFNARERRAVLEYIRSRYQDPKDAYTLYVTRERILENGYIIIDLESVGVLIEYRQDSGDYGNILVRNKLLTDVVSDYIKNHIPDNHAMSRAETVALLDELIDNLPVD